jgi:hypothetical protein
VIIGELLPVPVELGFEFMQVTLTLISEGGRGDNVGKCARIRNGSASSWMRIILESRIWISIRVKSWNRIRSQRRHAELQTQNGGV